MKLGNSFIYVKYIHELGLSALKHGDYKEVVSLVYKWKKGMIFFLKLCKFHSISLYTRHWLGVKSAELYKSWILTSLPSRGDDMYTKNYNPR